MHLLFLWVWISLLLKLGKRLIEKVKIREQSFVVIIIISMLSDHTEVSFISSNGSTGICTSTISILTLIAGRGVDLKKNHQVWKKLFFRELAYFAFDSSRVNKINTSIIRINEINCSLISFTKQPN